MDQSKEKSSKKKTGAKKGVEERKVLKSVEKTHKEAFNQLLDDAVLGVKKK